MLTIFKYDCDCECESCTDTTVQMLLSAAGGAALCRLHAFCSKLYNEHVASNVRSSVCSGAHALCTLACHAILIAEHCRSAEGMSHAVRRLQRVVSALVDDHKRPNNSASRSRSAPDSPGPDYACSPLIPPDS